MSFLGAKKSFTDVCCGALTGVTKETVVVAMVTGYERGRALLTDTEVTSVKASDSRRNGERSGVISTVTERDGYGVETESVADFNSDGTRPLRCGDVAAVQKIPSVEAIEQKRKALTDEM